MRRWIVVLTASWGVLLPACRAASVAPPPVSNQAPPDWPSSRVVEVTWVVDASKDGREWPLTLEVTVSTKTKRIEIGGIPTYLHPAYEPLCGAAPAAGDIATLTPGEQGDSGWVVRRDSPTTLGLYRWSAPVDVCTGDCRRSLERVTSVDVPLGYPTKEAIVRIDEHGARSPFDCEAAWSSFAP